MSFAGSVSPVKAGYVAPSSASLKPSKPISCTFRLASLVSNAYIRDCAAGCFPQTVETVGWVEFASGKPFSYCLRPSRRISSETSPILKYKLPELEIGVCADGFAGSK